ncbi:adenine aminohydrolase (AAH) [Leptomonas pyrrhocoris]|uniref:Adenine aminohydrolase (AAH) n=1 Tax=Leptomonas pyrrhocoris TaxID=157538 RepID=A0A0N0VHU0_LEPPY|nr:adenine aminohydrolase (AAH) [Leptomonas pyrrhocoris]KPA86174.1 adenine aminohydrolase (AAH) [Leptomonas pyrrhocoris]|eukprot:XP_015664613.1 adenine aminohydrolase (AAH) [Leptomonas pyrrhocoris]
MSNPALIEHLIEALPKAELHLHIEGTLSPELLFALAKKNGVELPYKTLEDVRAAYNFPDLQSFLNLYYRGMSVLITEDDFAELAYAYTRMMHENRVCHAEPFFDPQGHVGRGVTFRVVYDGLQKGFKRGAAEFGISVSLIFSFLRHLSEEECFAFVRDDTHPDNGQYIRELFAAKAFIAVGLDSSELGNPPEKFERLFRYCREELHVPFLVAHAGEEGPPSFMYNALDVLTVDRIDHGVAARLDGELCKRLRHQNVPLTVCPTSNVALCVFDDRAACGAAVMDLALTEKLCVTINSDDPAYLGGDVRESYRILAETGRLTPEVLKQLVLNSFYGSFLSAAQKQVYGERVEEVYKDVCCHALLYRNVRPKIPLMEEEEEERKKAAKRLQ